MKKRHKYHLRNKEKEILSVIAKVSFAVASVAIPGLAQIYPKLFENKSPQQKQYLKKRLRDLARDDIIILGGERIELTAKGKLLLANNTEFNPTKDAENWDGVWQVIAYDIPNHKTVERNYFRRKLNEVGFICFQKSLWLFPYECRENIAVLAQSLSLSPYVVYLTTEHLPDEIKFLKHFDLEKYSGND